jgi:uncharacterized protein
MIFNVAQLLKAPVGTSLEEDINEDAIQLDEDLKVIGPLTGHVRLRRTNQCVLVDGWVDLTLELTCTRCLTEFKQPMHVILEERFYPTVDVVTGMPLPPIDEDEVFAIDDHHLLNLTEAVRQRVLLDIQWRLCAKKTVQGSVLSVDMTSILALASANQRLMSA